MQTVKSLAEAQEFFLKNHEDSVICKDKDIEMVADVFPEAKGFFERTPHVLELWKRYIIKQYRYEYVHDVKLIEATKTAYIFENKVFTNSIQIISRKDFDKTWTVIEEFGEE